MIMNIVQKRRIMIGLVFLGIGLTGGLYFFPVNINSQYTCLFHRMVSDQLHPVGVECVIGNHQHDRSATPDESATGLSSHDLSEAHVMDNAELVHRYILPFGFLWWFSLFLIFIGGYLVKKNLPRKKTTDQIEPESQ